jgi:hypothetical protein
MSPDQRLGTDEDRKHRFQGRDDSHLTMRIEAGWNFRKGQVPISLNVTMPDEIFGIDRLHPELGRLKPAGLG